jgi:hypothetical protein
VPGPVTKGAAVTEHRVFVPCENGNIYGLRRVDGVVDASVRCSGRPTTAVVSSGDVFAIADEAGWVRLHRATSGESLAEVRVAVAISSIALALDIAQPRVFAATPTHLVTVDLNSKAVTSATPGLGSALISAIPAIDGTPPQTVAYASFANGDLVALS